MYYRLSSVPSTPLSFFINLAGRRVLTQFATLQIEGALP
jgi:hypothetical protein